MNGRNFAHSITSEWDKMIHKMQFLMLVNYYIQFKRRYTHTTPRLFAKPFHNSQNHFFFIGSAATTSPAAAASLGWQSRRHVGPTAKCRHIWPTCPCRGDTKLIPTASCCSCVAGGQRLLLLFGPPRCCCRGRHGVIIIVDDATPALMVTNNADAIQHGRRRHLCGQRCRPVGGSKGKAVAEDVQLVLQ